MSSFPLHSKIRRILQRLFNNFIGLFYKTKFKKEFINKNEISSILVIRINYRIGNTLFITPLIRALQKEIPTVKIDILLGAGFTKTLFDGFTNVDTVYDFPRKLLKNPLFLLKYIKQLRTKKYDLIINPNAGSSSDKLATLLAKGRYKLGVCKYDTWSAVNRCVEDDIQTKHEALKPLALMSIFSTDTVYDKTLSISLQKDEKKRAKEVLNHLLQKYNKIDYSTVIALFRDARFEKKIKKEWWIKLIDEIKMINSHVIFIDILSPDVKEPLTKDIIIFHEKNLRKLGAFCSQLDAFICGDTGPMHLACASGVSTIALFKHTNSSLYGTLGKHDKSYNIKDTSIKDLAQNIDKHIKNQAIIV